MFRRMLMGSTVFRAPENDQGHEADDLDEDFSLDEPPEDDEVDDVDPDADLDEVDDDNQDDEPPARQQSRGESRVAAATRTAAEAKREAAELRERLAAMEARSAAPAASQETAAQREQRLAQLEPWERTEVLRQEDSRRMESQIAQMRWESQEAADRTAYDALCARKPVAAKLKDEVEARLADMRKAGTTAPRETVLRWVIGDRALANEGKATGRAQKAASANRDRQTTRPTNGRADAAPSDRRGGDSSKRDKRIENYQL